MIQTTLQMRLVVVVEPVDFRRGIDGLCRICRELGVDPFSGALVVFRNRPATSIKALAYDGQGYWLCQKRLSAGRFKYWPDARGEAQRELLAHELAVLLAAGNPEHTSAAPQWRQVRPAI